MPEPGLYPDLFMRQGFGDLGEVPTSGCVAASPDIIPYGAEKTLTPQQLIDTYDGPLLDLPLQHRRVNRVYVRARNNYAGATSGQVYLYYATGNLLVNVGSWRRKRIRNANGTWGATVAAQQKGQICPGDQPFVWKPPLLLGPRFCLLARVSTPMHPNPLPANFRGWLAFVDWVRWNRSIAWHNLEIVTSLPPKGYVGSLVFQNLNPSPQFYAFAAVYSKVPQHSILRLWADPTRGFQGFDTGPQEINDGTGQLGAGQFFPPRFQTRVNCACQFPGSPVTPPKDAAIRLESLGFLKDPGAAENRKYESFMTEPAVLRLAPGSSGLPAGGKFVQITAFNVAFNPAGS